MISVHKVRGPCMCNKKALDEPELLLSLPKAAQSRYTFFLSYSVLCGLARAGGYF